MDPKKIDNLVKKYRAFFKKVMESSSDTPLDDDQKKAIGNNVLEELIEKALDRSGVPQEERENLVTQIREVIKDQCPDMLLDSPLKWTSEGFKRKVPKNNSK